MEPEKGQSDLCALVLAYFSAQAHVQEQPPVWISPESAGNPKPTSQTFMGVCRSSRFAAHLGDISQCVHLFCINFVKNGKSWAHICQYIHTSWFPLERIPLLWAWHLRRWLYRPLVNTLWFPNVEQTCKETSACVFVCLLASKNQPARFSSQALSKALGQSG